MLFSSTTFMFVFLPLMLLVYYILPGRVLKNLWLFAASIVFYAWGEPTYVFLMLASIVINWLFALLIGPAKKDAGGVEETAEAAEEAGEEHAAEAAEEVAEAAEKSAEEIAEETTEASEEGVEELAVAGEEGAEAVESFEEKAAEAGEEAAEEDAESAEVAGGETAEAAEEAGEEHAAEAAEEVAEAAEKSAEEIAEETTEASEEGGEELAVAGEEGAEATEDVEATEDAEEAAGVVEEEVAEEAAEEDVKDAKTKKPGLRKVLLVVIVLIDIAIIGFFKYESFLAQSVNALAGFELIPDLELPLPIGISFYTLQAISYVIDVYRGDVKPERNILYLGMYIACFPQLIAGPIVRYQTIADQVRHRKETLEDFSSGLRLFIVGFGKKVLLSNIVAILAEDMLAYGGANIGVIGSWGGLIAYTFQIYFDFGGYSDMAIGLGRMMGFKYLRNFNYPYISKSITEFWRRWHISLSSFFRDYIYIPLGGNRVSKPRHILNILIVWVTTGLWHGAGWNYILWGLYYGVLLILEKYVWGKGLAKLPAVLQHIYTVFIFMMGWALFWITDMGQLSEYLSAMFGAYGLTGTMTFWELGVWEYWPVFVACIVASTPIAPWLKEKLTAWAEKRKLTDFRQTSVVNPKCYDASSLCAFQIESVGGARSAVVTVVLVLLDVALVAVLIAGLLSVASGAFNPFIYFQF